MHVYVCACVQVQCHWCWQKKPSFSARVGFVAGLFVSEQMTLFWATFYSLSFAFMQWAKRSNLEHVWEDVCLIIIIIPWHRTHQTFWRAAAWPAGLWPSSAGPGDVGSSTAAEASGWPVPASAPSGSHHWGRPPPLPPLAPGSLANTTKMLFMLHPLQSLSGVTPPCSLSSPWRKASREAVNYCRTCYERPASKSLRLRSQTQSSLVGSGHLNWQDFIQPQAKCFFFCFSPPCLLVKQASICCLKKGVPWFLYILHCFVLIVQKKRAGSGNPFLHFEKQQKLNKTPTYYD